MQKKLDNSLSTSRPDYTSPITSHSYAAHQGQFAQPSTTAHSATSIANEAPAPTSIPSN